MFNIEELYTSDELNDFMVDLARKRRINSFDDYKQEAFLYMLEKGENSLSMSQAKKIADRIANRYKRKQIREASYSLMENVDSYDDENDAILWEDRHIMGA